VRGGAWVCLSVVAAVFVAAVLYHTLPGHIDFGANVCPE
jgi:hypothetical protein